MCGIAGYSLGVDSCVDRTLAAQALLAGIAERGADAVGYAHRGASPEVTIHKQMSGATALLEAIELPNDATDALVHVRDYTKGHPTVLANNHPIRHGSVVGIHNGIIVNDEEILAAHGIERAEPDMTVDSEAIFALMELTGSDRAALEELRGSFREWAASAKIASESTVIFASARAQEWGARSSSSFVMIPLWIPTTGPWRTGWLLALIDG